MDTEKENWYRTGAVAKLLGTSQHRIRELARARVIESEVRNGYRYVPGRELERLQKEGLPPMPANLDSEPVHGSAQHDGPPRPLRGSPELYAEPSHQLARSKEKVIRLEHEAQGKRIQQEIHKMEKTRKEESSREREARNIQLWRNGYIQRVINSLPGEVCAKACEMVEAILNAVPPQTNVTRQVNEIIDAKLAPFKEREARQKLLAEHRERMKRLVGYISLPFGVTEDERDEAREAALAHLVENVAVSAPDWQVRKAIGIAVSDVVDRVNRRQAESDRKRLEEEHRQRIDLAVIWCVPNGGNRAEHEQARKQVKVALDRLPPTATYRQMKQAEAEALAPIEAGIKQRVEREERERREESERLHNQNRIDSQVQSLPSKVDARLRELGKDGTIRFRDDADRNDLRDKVTRRIRPIFVREINADPRMSDIDITSRIDDLVDEHYEEFCN